MANRMTASKTGPSFGAPNRQQNALLQLGRTVRRKVTFDVHGTMEDAQDRQSANGASTKSS